MVLSQDGNEAKGLLIVPTEELRDVGWPEEFKKWGVSPEGIKRICYSSLAKENLDKYDFILYDEYHRTTLPNLKKLVEYLKNPKVYALALTATLPRKIVFEEDAERIHHLRTVLPIVYTLTIDEAVELGLVADFEITVLKYYLDEVNRNVIGGTVKVPFKQTEAARYAYLTNNLKRATVIAKADPSKIGWKMATISKRTNFLYNLPSKLMLAKRCLEQLQRDTNARTVVFAGSIEQANELCGENVFHSKTGREALDKFQNGELNLIGSVRCLNEGVNLEDPHQALVVQLDSVERSIVQRIGRLIRIRYENLEFRAKIVILVALKTADEKWYESATAEFQTKRIKEYLVPLNPPVKNGT
jgi:superfamily II DNA or RNA helicase